MKFQKALLTLTICLFALRGFSIDLASTAMLPAADGQSQLAAMAAKMDNSSQHKLSFTEKIALKLVKKKAEKMAKKMANGGAAPAIEKGVYIIVAIFIPFLAVGLATNFEGSDWLICLLLTFLFYLPGLIYALIKMNTYYS